MLCTWVSSPFGPAVLWEWATCDMHVRNSFVFTHLMAGLQVQRQLGARGSLGDLEEPGGHELFGSRQAALQQRGLAGAPLCPGALLLSRFR